MHKTRLEAILDIKDNLRKMIATENKNVWDCLIGEIKEKKTVTNKYISVLMIEIAKYVKELNNEDKKSIYKEIENVLINKDLDEMGLFIGLIEINLENKFLSEIIENAYDEASYK